MADDPVPEDAPVWLEAARKSGAGAAGSLLGYTLAGTPGAIIGGAAPPVLELALGWLGDQWREQSSRSGQQVLEGAAAESGLSPEQLASRLGGTPKRLQLAGLTLSAAAMTTDQDKLRALARALGAGATDDALVDPEMLAVTALADMEAPHIKVLQRMAASSYAGGRWRRINDRFQFRPWTKSALEREIPEMGYALEPVLGTLLRHGLLIEIDEDLGKALAQRDDDIARGFGDVWRSPEPKMSITDFGGHCLDLLREIAAAEEEDEACERQEEAGADRDRPAPSSE